MLLLLELIELILVESAIGIDTERTTKLRSSTANAAQTPIRGRVNIAAGNGFSYHINPNQRTKYDQHTQSAAGQPLTSSTVLAKHSDIETKYTNHKAMEFLIPQVPNGITVQTTTATATTAYQSKIVGGASITLNDIKCHLSENFHLIQKVATNAQTKMTKKQLKLAQAQFDKLTQINIHLQGMI